jgi:hypothetical protein
MLEWFQIPYGRSGLLLTEIFLTTFPDKQHAKLSDISAMYLYVIQCLFSMEKISCTADRGIWNHSNIYGKSGDFKWSSVKVLADNQRLERPCWTSNRSEKQQRFLRIPWRPLLADFACNTVFPAKKSKISRPIRGNDSHTGFIIYNLRSKSAQRPYFVNTAHVKLHLQNHCMPSHHTC